MKGVALNVNVNRREHKQTSRRQLTVVVSVRVKYFVMCLISLNIFNPNTWLLNLTE